MTGPLDLLQVAYADLPTPGITRPAATCTPPQLPSRILPSNTAKETL